MHNSKQYSENFRKFLGPDKEEVAAASQHSDRLFSYPAMSEGDFLTLLMAEKFDRESDLGCFYSFVTRNSISEMIDIFSKELGQDVIDQRCFCRYTIVVFEECMINLFSNDDITDDAPRSFNTYFYAGKDKFDFLFEKYRNINWGVNDDEQPYITWATQSQQGIKTNRLKASANKDVKDVYYPSIQEGVENFYELYDKSTSPILVVLGPPGMGKTSFIRNYIYKYHKTALVTYDQQLMETDEFFLFFLEQEYNVLLLEDFDIFLKSREDNDNKIKVIKKLNLEPILLKYNEQLEEKEAYSLETKLIQQIGRHDTKKGPLTNLNDGGKGGLTPSIEVKSRISASMKGRPKTQEWKDMMKIKMKGKNNSPSTQFQKGYSPWNKGSSLSQEGQSISSTHDEQH